MDQFELKINALLDKILEEKVTRIIEQKFGSHTGPVFNVEEATTIHDGRTQCWI